MSVAGASAKLKTGAKVAYFSNCSPGGGVLRSDKVIVVGGGPAGLMAAGTAGVGGSRVLLLEKMDRVGLKLGLTGKGRCNLTNILPLEEMFPHYGAGGRWLRHALWELGNRTLVEFFRELGIRTVIERGGRVFPEREKAPEIARALQRWVLGAGVEVRKNSRVDRILIEAGRPVGVWCGDDFYRGDCVVVATGGLSYPKTGSTGDGYALASAAGHTIVPPRPALVPLETPEGGWARTLPGLALKNVRVSVLAGGKKLAAGFGEMLFTHTGVSGPVVLSLSAAAAAALGEGKEVKLLIDLKPALDEKKLDQRLLRELGGSSRRRLGTILGELLPRRLVPVCLEMTGVPPDRTGDQVTREQRQRLRRWLKELPVEIVSARPLAEAIVTAGGVSLKEVNPRSMESRLLKGLFFAGEILDLDADTGGYNLQAAFSTGHLAGASASRLPKTHM